MEEKPGKWKGQTVTGTSTKGLGYRKEQMWKGGPRADLQLPHGTLGEGVSDTAGPLARFSRVPLFLWVYSHWQCRATAGAATLPQGGLLSPFLQQACWEDGGRPFGAVSFPPRAFLELVCSQSWLFHYDTLRNGLICINPAWDSERCLNLTGILLLFWKFLVNCSSNIAMSPFSVSRIPLTDRYTYFTFSQVTFSTYLSINMNYFFSM